jgi:hypothetical protein
MDVVEQRAPSSWICALVDNEHRWCCCCIKTPKLSQLCLVVTYMGADAVEQATLVPSRYAAG